MCMHMCVLCMVIHVCTQTGQRARRGEQISLGLWVRIYLTFILLTGSQTGRQRPGPMPGSPSQTNVTPVNKHKQGAALGTS